MGWVLRVFNSIAGTLSPADTLEISCHSPTGVLLSALEPMESKIHTRYRNLYVFEKTAFHTKSLKYST